MKKIINTFFVLFFLVFLMSTILGGVDFFEYIKYTFDPSINLSGVPNFMEFISYPYFWRKLFLFAAPLFELILYFTLKK